MASYCEQLLLNLVHDLRQPLGTLESSAFYLNMLLNDAQPQAAEQTRLIQRQVEEAARILNAAAAEVRRLRDQAALTDSLDLTKAATAGVA